MEQVKLHCQTQPGNNHIKQKLSLSTEDIASPVAGEQIMSQIFKMCLSKNKVG